MVKVRALYRGGKTWQHKGPLESSLFQGKWNIGNLHFNTDTTAHRSKTCVNRRLSRTNETKASQTRWANVLCMSTATQAAPIMCEWLQQWEGFLLVWRKLSIYCLLGSELSRSKHEQTTKNTNDSAFLHTDRQTVYWIRKGNYYIMAAIKIV